MLASSHPRVSPSRCPQETQTTHHAVLPDERWCKSCSLENQPKNAQRGLLDATPTRFVAGTLFHNGHGPSVSETGHAGAEPEYFAHKIAKTNADRMQQLQIICVYMYS